MGHVQGREEVQSVFRRTHEGRRPLEKHRCRWEDNFVTGLWRNKFWECKLDLSESGRSEKAVVNTVMSFRVKQSARTLLTSWGTVSLWRMSLFRGVGCVSLSLSSTEELILVIGDHNFYWDVGTEGKISWLVTFCWQHCECVKVNCGEVLARRLEFQQSSMKKAVETEVVSDVI